MINILYIDIKPHTRGVLCLWDDEVNFDMKNRSCPKCSSAKDVVPIEYGYPGVDLWEDEQSGKVRVGGCMTMDDSPEWYCKACRYEWQTDHPQDGRVICLECGEIEEDCICE